MTHKALPSPPSDRLLTLTQVSELLGVHRTTLYRWNNEGVLPFIRVWRNVRVSQSVVERIAREGIPARSADERVA